MEWSEDVTFDLIREVRERPVIWDPRNVLKKKKARKDDAYKEIAALPMFINRVPYEELKKKFNSLIQSYRSYRRKSQKKRSGSGSSDIYKPTWVFFKEMDAFLKDAYEPKGASDTVSNQFLCFSFFFF